MTRSFFFLGSLNQILIKKTQEVLPQPFFFGFLGGMYYLIYLIFQYLCHVSTHQPLFLLFLICICLGLVLKNQWPSIIRPFFPIYWYLSLLLCLPFFFFFTLLKAPDQLHFLNSSTMLFWLLFLVDPLSYILIMLFGFALSLLFIGSLEPLILLKDKWIIIGQFTSSFFFILFFLYQKKQNDLRLETAHKITSIIAHEIRTPLRAMDGVLKAIKKMQSMSSIDNEEPKKAEWMTLIDYGERELMAAFRMIDIMLTKTKSHVLKNYPLEICSIHRSIDSALARYPFNIGEREKLSWVGENFLFSGNETLMIHVIFNLLKNALYSIAAAGKGRIIMTLTQEVRFNVLSFKDTGIGISPDIVKHLFKRFYTTFPNGTGIGLYFCKNVMNAMGGEIICEAKEGEFSSFLLYFPKIIACQESQ